MTGREEKIGESENGERETRDRNAVETEKEIDKAIKEEQERARQRESAKRVRRE